MSEPSSCSAECLDLRRSLGYKFNGPASCTTTSWPSLAYLDGHGAEYVSTDQALALATRSAKPALQADREGVVRCFARSAEVLDPDHEVPSARVLMHASVHPGG